MKEIHDLDFKDNILINPRYIIALRPYSREIGEPKTGKCTKVVMTNNNTYVIAGTPRDNAHLLS